MRGDQTLSSLRREMRRKYRCHTLILYGSRARGEGSTFSDYDLLGIREKGPIVHDARRVGESYLDAFIYPQAKCSPSELIRVRGGTVLFQRDGFGDAFLRRVDRVYARGPKALSTEQANARRVWTDKMLQRAKRGDPEGDFRRAWLLTTLLEDYFALRNQWYEGPKAALKWLNDNEPQTGSLFEAALKPGAAFATVERLARAVVGKN